MITPCVDDPYHYQLAEQERADEQRREDFEQQQYLEMRARYDEDDEGGVVAETVVRLVAGMACVQCGGPAAGELCAYCHEGRWADSRLFGGDDE